MKICVNKNELTRNNYIRVYASEVQEGDWDKFASYCLGVFGVYPTEDGTVGQYCQEKSIASNSTCSGGLNLYGLKIKPIQKRVIEESQKGLISLSQ